MNNMTQTVHKFGGSSLSSAQRYERGARIILEHTQPGDCVVVSAAGKKNNTLVTFWERY